MGRGRVKAEATAIQSIPESTEGLNIPKLSKLPTYKRIMENFENVNPNTKLADWPRIPMNPNVPDQQLSERRGGHSWTYKKEVYAQLAKNKRMAAEKVYSPPLKAPDVIPTEERRRHLNVGRRCGLKGWQAGRGQGFNNPSRFPTRGEYFVETNQDHGSALAVPRRGKPRSYSRVKKDC